MTKILWAVVAAMASTALLAQSTAPVRLTTAESVLGGYGTPIAAVGGDFNNDGHPDIVTIYLGNPSAIALMLGNGDGTFQPPAIVASLGYSPEAVAAGDFNNDGYLDVAILTNAPNVQVYLGDGAGGFTYNASYPVGNNCCGWIGNSLVAAHLRSRTELDLVALNLSDRTLSVLLGNGNGTFQAPATYATTNGPAANPQAVAVGDVNGDGKPDLVVAATYSTSLVVLLGNGDGTFQAPLLYSANNAYSNPNGIALADLNGNKNLDVVLATNQGATVLMGNGDGTFQSPVNYPVVPTGDQISPESVAIANLNNSGKLDLIISDGQGSDDSAVWVFPGNGDGTFQYPQGYAVNPGPTSIVLADFNLDQRLDFAVASNGYSDTGLITVALGNGDGTFQAGTRVGYTSQEAEGFVAADFTNKGNLDIALAEDDGTIDIFPGNSHGAFATSATVTTIGSSGGNPAIVRAYYPGWAPFTASGIQAADMNGDGKLDLVASISFGRFGGGPQGLSGTEIAVMLGNGNGTFAPGVFYDPGDTSGIVAPVIADFNNDGKPDVAVVNYDGLVSVLLNQGGGVLGTPTLINATQGVGATPPIAADFNGDGNMDLAVPAGSSGVWILLGNGNGTFQPPVFYAADGNADVAIAADFNSNNGNQNLDLAVGGPSNTSFGAQILLGNGDGTFTQGSVLDVFPNCGGYYYGQGLWSMAAADLNMDGNLDLIAAPWDTSQCGANLGVVVYSGNGDGTFSQNVTGAPFLVGDNQAGVVVGDFNNDGTPDVAVLTTGQGGGPSFVTVLLNRSLPVSASPASLSYATQLLETSSKAQTVVLTNDTSSPYSLSGLGLTGTDVADFTLTNHCPSSLKAGLHCNLSVTFAPTAIGTRTAAVTNAGATLVPLTGVGTQVQLSPAYLTSSGTVTLTNVGASALRFVGPGIKPVGYAEFDETNNCGSTLSAGASCTISVEFLGGPAGNAEILIYDNGGGSPQIVPLFFN